MFSVWWKISIENLIWNFETRWINQKQKTLMIVSWMNILLCAATLINKLALWPRSNCSDDQLVMCGNIFQMLTYKQADNISGHVSLSSNDGWHATDPAPGVSLSNILDHDATVHVRETKVPEATTLRLSLVSTELDCSTIRSLPLTRLILFVCVADQSRSLVCLL